MSALLVELSSDPRSNLAAGLGDAGEAIRNLTLLASLPKPAGFFDSDNPAGLPPPKPVDPEEEAKKQDEEDVAETGRDDESDAEFGERSQLRNFAHNDMAFADDLPAPGNSHSLKIGRASWRDREG